jgi:UPF0271 protein
MIMNEIVRYVLDSSAFINAGMVPDGELFSTPAVEAEIKDFRSKMLFESRNIMTMTPERKFVSQVKTKAFDTGDLTALSEQDISVLALAIQLDATILTDDYDIQNLAEEMGVRYSSVSVPGIKKIFKRMPYCDRCRRYRSGEVCQRCGSRLRMKISGKGEKIE